MFVDISRQTRTMVPNNSTTRLSLPMKLACLSSNIRQRVEPSLSSILSKMIAKLLKNYCIVVFVDISRQTRTMIPNNSTTRLFLPMKLCIPFKYYMTKGWAKFQPHTLQNDCKIAEKLLYCGVCWHFTADKDHDPQQLNNQIVSAYETFQALQAFQVLWDK